MSHLVYITPFGETDGVTLSRLGCNCGSGSGSVLYVVQQLINWQVLGPTVCVSIMVDLKV